jgi:nucleotide-binding universal stress UspA family protein
MKNILVALDLADTTPAVLLRAREFAHALAAKVWLLHAAPPNPDFAGFEAGPPSVRKSVADELHDEHRKLQRLADELRGEGLECTALLIQGATVEVVLKEAGDIAADLIMIGSHGHGLFHQILAGATSETILHRSRIPVLVVPVH